MQPTYLDYNATAPMRPEAAQAVGTGLALGGNPSSVHAWGRRSRALVEDSRTVVAGLVGARPERLVFTSGGAEANALAIWSAVASGRTTRLIIGATEHDTVLHAAHASGLPVEFWPVDTRGVADLDWLADRLDRGNSVDEKAFVALVLANNETGVIQPVAEAAGLVRRFDGWLHVDAVQAAGKLAVDMDGLGADTLAISAHKLGGPQGVGALAYNPRASVRPMLHGGGQERGLRAGTENTAGIAGFAAASTAALRDLAQAHTQAAWRDAAAERLRQEAGVVVAGQGAPRLPGTLCVASERFASALQVMALDLEGVMVSAGAACSSGKVTSSRVLAAMGYGELAKGAIRVSGGWNTSKQDWARFAEVWLAVHARQLARSRLREFA